MQTRTSHTRPKSQRWRRGETNLSHNVHPAPRHLEALLEARQHARPAAVHGVLARLRAAEHAELAHVVSARVCIPTLGGIAKAKCDSGHGHHICLRGRQEELRCKRGWRREVGTDRNVGVLSFSQGGSLTSLPGRGVNAAHVHPSHTFPGAPARGSGTESGFTPSSRSVLRYVARSSCVVRSSSSLERRPSACASSATCAARDVAGRRAVSRHASHISAQCAQAPRRGRIARKHTTVSAKAQGTANGAKIRYSKQIIFVQTHLQSDAKRAVGLLHPG